MLMQEKNNGKKGKQLETGRNEETQTYTLSTTAKDKKSLNFSGDKIMLPQNYVNVYCHSCGKICSSNIKPKPAEEWEQFIKSWLECPFCIECVQKKLRGKK